MKPNTKLQLTAHALLRELAHELLSSLPRTALVRLAKSEQIPFKKVKTTKLVEDLKIHFQGFSINKVGLKFIGDSTLEVKVKVLVKQVKKTPAPEGAVSSSNESEVKATEATTPATQNQTQQSSQ